MIQMKESKIGYCGVWPYNKRAKRVVVVLQGAMICWEHGVEASFLRKEGQWDVYRLNKDFYPVVDSDFKDAAKRKEQL